MLNKSSKPIDITPHKVSLYSIKDVATDTFGPIFEAQNERAAKRIVSHQISVSPASSLAMYSQDYQLWLIGHVHKISGALTGKAEYIASCSTLVSDQSPTPLEAAINQASKA